MLSVSKPSVLISEGSRNVFHTSSTSDISYVFFFQHVVDHEDFTHDVISSCSLKPGTQQQQLRRTNTNKNKEWEIANIQVAAVGLESSFIPR